MTNIDLRDALKHAASALKAHGPEFALAGSYALWAYGGSGTRARRRLRRRGGGHRGGGADAGEGRFPIDRTPEDWLFKACVEQQFVIDVLHQLNGTPVDADVIAAAEELDVLAIRMRVLSPTHVHHREVELAQRAPLRFRGAVTRRSGGARAGGLGQRARRHRPKTTLRWRFWCSPTGWASPT